MQIMVAPELLLYQLSISLKNQMFFRENGVFLFSEARSGFAVVAFGYECLLYF